MEHARRLVRTALERVDRWYYRWYGLRSLGPVLHLGRVRYRGPALRFEDGTVLQDRAPIGRLHFNNAQIAAIGEGSLQRTGFRFAKLMRQSLRQLAECASRDPAFRDIEVFQGVTWIPDHGRVVGFESRPLPSGWRKWLLAGHFRLLMWAFAPAAQTRARVRGEPRIYWLTRTALTRNLGKLKPEPAGDGGMERASRRPTPLST